MTHSPLHLDLLKDSERLSSSPVRLRVMFPVLSFTLALIMLVWWGMLFAQRMVLVTQRSNLTQDITEKNTTHKQVLKEKAVERELQAEVAQLTAYMNARICYGPILAELAKVLPTRIQLTELSIPVAPPQNLRPDIKRPPLLGPDNPVEPVTLLLSGRTPRAAPVNVLLMSLQAPAFTNIIRQAEIPKGAFRQDVVAESRLLLFDVKCSCADRRFE